MKKLIACILMAVLLMTSVAPTLNAEASSRASSQGITSHAQALYSSWMGTEGFGAAIDYPSSSSSNWYANLDYYEVVCRLVYAAVESVNTEDYKAFVCMLWNRRTTSESPFANVNTLYDVAVQPGQFSQIIGTISTTSDARIPDTTSTRWSRAVWYTALIWSVVLEQGVPQEVSLLPTGYTNQLYCKGYNDFFDYAYDSGGAMYHGSTRIYDLMIPTLGSLSTISYAKTLYEREDEEEGSSMVDEGILIYYDKNVN